MRRHKTRTREHIIASMSAHHVGYIISKAGYTLDISYNDYGIDGYVTTFGDRGEPEGDPFYIQFKATDNIEILSSGDVSFSLRMMDIYTWSKYFFPVIIIVFDSVKEKSYYFALQEYFKRNPILDDEKRRTSLTVHIDAKAVVTEGAVRSWRDLKNKYRMSLR